MIIVDYIAQALDSLDTYFFREDGKVIPWYDKVDLSKLDFNSTKNNVLGQVFGSNIEGKKALGCFLGLGFSFVWTGDDWSELRDTDKERWINEIKKRKSQHES